MSYFYLIRCLKMENVILIFFLVAVAALVITVLWKIVVSPKFEASVTIGEVRAEVKTSSEKG